MVSPRNFLKCVGVGFAGADTHGVFERRDENLTVADLAGLGGGGDRLRDLVDLFAGDGDLDAHFGQEVHGVFGAAIDLHVALLPPVAFDLGHGHAVNPDP